MSADTEPVHICLGANQCDACRREDEFWRDYEARERVVHGVEALEYHEAQEREAS